jgi:hypothetical protein
VAFPSKGAAPCKTVEMDKNLSLNEIRTLCAQFVIDWRDSAGDERQEAQSFVRDLLLAFGITETKAALYEKRVKRSSTGNQGYIDALVPGLLLVEMKSAGRPLQAAEIQALDYIQHLDEAEAPRYVLTCDFKTFRLLDLQAPDGDDTTEFDLEALPSQVESLAFLAGYQTRTFGSAEQEEASVRAAKMMGDLYEALEGSGYSEHESSIFLVRTLFALYADDAGIWQRDSFTEFIETRTNADGSDLGGQLTLMFQVLNQPNNKRVTKLDELLMRFPYVNGGIFAEPLTIPSFDKRMRAQLLKACAFNWSSISPAIFGSLFQAVKDVASRRKLGEHYTSERNIRKLIDPLFMDELRFKFEENANSLSGLLKLRESIGHMRFLDPACGCGNFLVVAYKEMRQLELDIVLKLQELGDKSAVPALFFDKSDLAIQLDHFAGIEVEEWPARIAETALRLAEHQANQLMELSLGRAPETLPLDTLSNIKVANALDVDWGELLPNETKSQSIILGNPPFLGHISRSKEQTEDLMRVWGRRDIGRLDYVTAWYKKASDLLASRSHGKFAFVSTNSITQGEPVPALFGPLFDAGWRIFFAHKTFAWSSDAPGEANVHCVIIGFDKSTRSECSLFTYSNVKSDPSVVKVKFINAYLASARNVFVQKRQIPLSPDLPSVSMGSMPRDGGNLLINTLEEYQDVMSDTIAAKYVRKYAMGNELIKNIPRWCLWLVDLVPSDVKNSSVLRDRLMKVADTRRQSSAASTRQMAETPHLFGQRSQTPNPYLAIPKVFSEMRRYATVEYLESDVIAGDKIYRCDDPTGFAFAIASSSMFITWQKTVGGRLESRPSFSNTLVWNNLPLPPMTDSVKEAIINAGHGLLEFRNGLREISLADLYNPLAMNPELIKFHNRLDRVVDKAFGAVGLIRSNAEREKILFDRYAELKGHK